MTPVAKLFMESPPQACVASLSLSSPRGGVVPFVGLPQLRACLEAATLQLCLQQPEAIVSYWQWFSFAPNPSCLPSTLQFCTEPTPNDACTNCCLQGIPMPTRMLSRRNFAHSDLLQDTLSLTSMTSQCKKEYAVARNETQPSIVAKMH